jgi:hypothetical protein
MTIDRRYLRNLEKSAFIFISPEQKRVLLERFGTEPEPHVWSDQDIAIQISNYLYCGEFEKPMIDNSDGKRIDWTDDMLF